MRFLFAAVLVSLSAGAFGQVDDDMAWIQAHSACVTTYAEKFGNTKELPNDVAAAALITCRGLAEKGLNQIRSLSPDQRRVLTTEMEEKGRRLAIRAVIEKRNAPVK